MRPELLEITQQAALMATLLCLPAAVTAAVIGLGMGIAQAVTSIQDQTLAQSVKIIAVLLAVLISGGWISRELLQFGNEIFVNFPALVRR